jgi:ribonucleoside-diphosphate reductase alpha chain
MSKRYSYEQSFEESLQYFGQDNLAAKTFVDKYALRDHEQNLLELTPKDMHVRIASEFARVEKKKFKNPMNFEAIFSYLDRFTKIVPQGSPMSAIGNPYQYMTLSNCYVVESPLDAYNGIHRTDEQLTQISKRRGGVGLDISNLRPEGSLTQNAARTSTGIVPFMERYSNSIREVGQSGRRGALMITLSVHHPEVLNFAKVKRDSTKVTGANISIRLSDEFLDAVKKDKDYEQRWPVDASKPVMSRMVKARDVWMQIIENAHFRAEPGLLFWDTILRESPADCYADEGFRTVSTNPCAELPLSILDSCRLLLINLFTYVKNPFTRDSFFDFDEFYKDSQILQRFMDDMIDLELESIDRIIKKIKNDPEPPELKRTELEMWQKVRKSCENGRRTGSGITALGDTIAALGLKYGSNKSIKITEKIYRTLKLGCYRSSVDMAKELGPFPVWDHKKEKKNTFLNRIKEEDYNLYRDMKKYGRRNISLLTTAPAGSVSIETQTTSGIEPLFMMSYTRRKKINPNDKKARVDFIDQTGDCWQEFEVYHPKLKLWMDITGEEDIKKSPYFGCCAEDLDWKQRVKLQAAAGRHIDHSISSTVNLPEDVSVEKVAEIYESAWKMGCKGVTVYRKNCRTGVLVDKKSQEEEKIEKTKAPKRPKVLPCDVHHTSVKGEEYLVLVGLLNNEPYEVFAGLNGHVKKSAKVGEIIKLKRGHYKAMLEHDVEIPSIADYSNDEEEALTRMTSTAIRHGADISFIAHQLEKVDGPMNSLARAMSRSLKKYIANGTKVHGEMCQSCTSDNLARQEGCITCLSCGWSKCS